MENLPESHQTPTIKLYHWVVIVFVGMLTVAGLLAWIQHWTLEEFANALITLGFVTFIFIVFAYEKSADTARIQNYKAIRTGKFEEVEQHIAPSRRMRDKGLLAVTVVASLNVGLGLLIRWLIQ